MRIDQRMKLAPRMIQSMEILQMSQAALEERIDQELVSNPTLELQEPGADSDVLEADRKQQERDSREGERELVVGDDRDRAADFERLTNISEQYGESWDANTYGTARNRVSGSSGERDQKRDAMENTAARTDSLYDQLIAQWHLVETDPKIQKIGEYLIGFIDADGYLRTDPDMLLSQAPVDLGAEDLDQTLQRLQQNLEPPGLAARDLRECFLLQIDARVRQHPDEQLEDERLLVCDYLKDIEANHLPRIAKVTGWGLDRVTEAIHSLRKFQPHPGRSLADHSPRRIRPDAIIEYDEDSDRYIVQLTHGRLPALHISPTYLNMAADKSVEKKTRDFVGNNLRSARWLIDAIRQRSGTLLRVIGVVVEAQRQFLEQGAQALRPLPMTLVADQLGIHVATVSRAVSEKYVQTPRGIFPLRSFFSGGTETESGDSMSWTAVQATLEQIIEHEEKSNPLSDDALVEKLKEHGIEIARRTVAKYRKKLNIPAARQRRQY